MAHRHDDLFDSLVTFENLLCAFRKAAKGKRSQPNVAQFEFELESNLFFLQRALQEGRYRPGKYHSFRILDPKPRLISAAPFRDRVVHHALINRIEPVFESGFIGTSYANRKGKGTHAAIGKAQSWARRYAYVLQCDIRQFFPGIDHDILLALIARRIADERVLALCALILQGGEGVLDEEYDMVYFPGDDLLAVGRPRGLPIGNLTSQFWANVYLDSLDQFVKRRLGCRPYLRYVDDFLLFSDSKAQLWTWKGEIVNHLAGLRLTLHERSSTVFPVKCGIPFLGFRIYPEFRRLKRRNVIAFARRMRCHERKWKRGECSLEDLNRCVRGWIAHAAHGDTWRLRSDLFAHPLGNKTGREP